MAPAELVAAGIVAHVAVETPLRSPCAASVASRSCLVGALWRLRTRQTLGHRVADLVMRVGAFFLSTRLGLRHLRTPCAAPHLRPAPPSTSCRRSWSFNTMPSAIPTPSLLLRPLSSSRRAARRGSTRLTFHWAHDQSRPMRSGIRVTAGICRYHFASFTGAIYILPLGSASRSRFAHTIFVLRSLSGEIRAGACPSSRCSILSEFIPFCALRPGIYLRARCRVRTSFPSFSRYAWARPGFWRSRHSWGSPRRSIRA